MPKYSHSKLLSLSSQKVDLLDIKSIIESTLSHFNFEAPNENQIMYNHYDQDKISSGDFDTKSVLNQYCHIHALIGLGQTLEARRLLKKMNDRNIQLMLSSLLIHDGQTTEEESASILAQAYVNIKAKDSYSLTIQSGTQLTYPVISKLNFSK